MCDEKNDDCAECRQKEHLKIGLCCAVGAWFAFGIISGVIWLTCGSEGFAQFGDSFGVINALFSSVAVAGAIYAVILQQRELALTREEMRQARKAQQDSAGSQGRMARIQGYSTILADLSNDMKAARDHADPLRLFILEMLEFERSHQAAYSSLNFPSNLRKEGETLLRRGEILGVWKCRLYHPNESPHQIPRDLLKMRELAENQWKSENETISEMVKKKAEYSELLFNAITEESVKSKTADGS